MVDFLMAAIRTRCSFLVLITCIYFHTMVCGQLDWWKHCTVNGSFYKNVVEAQTAEAGERTQK
jgi:hypothetical protein